MIVFFVLFEWVQSKGVLFFLGDDAGFETNVYNDYSIETKGINWISDHGITYFNAYGSVSSCSPSRSSILTGIPSHQNGMYGLHNGYHNFNAFSSVLSLPNILSENDVYTGMCGKKNIGPKENFKFDFEESEETGIAITQIGRNITRMNICINQFFEEKPVETDFLLYIAFHDPHRCGHTQPQYGNFCEKFGNRDFDGNFGIISDWTPQYVDPENLPKKWKSQPQTEITRKEIASRYTTISRMDDGISLFLSNFEKRNELENTLVIFASDNGPPFLGGRTNLYQFGIRTPLIISHPHFRNEKSKNYHPKSILDIFPTILDYFNLAVPSYQLFNRDVLFTGDSLIGDFLKLKKIRFLSRSQRDIFASQSFHEITMNYVMRAIYSGDLELIHNINFRLPFPIDQDFYLSDEFQQVLKTDNNLLKSYYYRPEFELYNMTEGVEKQNLAEKHDYKIILDILKQKLSDWQWKTSDPWRCSPDGVLQDSGKYKHKPICMPLYNKIDL